MMFSILVAIVIAVAALIAYTSFCTAAKADHMSEEYWLKKIQEYESENLKNKEN